MSAFIFSDGASLFQILSFWRNTPNTTFIALPKKIIEVSEVVAKRRIDSKKQDEESKSGGGGSKKKDGKHLFFSNCCIEVTNILCVADPDQKSDGGGGIGKTADAFGIGVIVGWTLKAWTGWCFLNRLSPRSNNSGFNVRSLCIVALVDFVYGFSMVGGRMMSCPSNEAFLHVGYYCQFCDCPLTWDQAEAVFNSNLIVKGRRMAGGHLVSVLKEDEQNWLKFQM